METCYKPQDDKRGNPDAHSFRHLSFRLCRIGSTMKRLISETYFYGKQLGICYLLTQARMRIKDA